MLCLGPDKYPHAIANRHKQIMENLPGYPPLPSQFKICLQILSTDSKEKLDGALLFLFFPRQDPFRGGENILVLCETCLPTGEPIPSNTRAKARESFDAAPGLEPWFGIEQEYTLFDKVQRHIDCNSVCLC